MRMLSKKRSISPSSADPDSKRLAANQDEIHKKLLWLVSLFPLEKFQDRVPPIIWKHQLYPLAANRTLVDRSVNSLCQKGNVRLFNLGTTVGVHETAMVFLNDYRDFVYRNCLSSLTEKFLSMVENCPQTTFSKEDIERHAFSESDISELVRRGLLAVHRSVGHWLLSIPNCGEFMKAFTAGRKAVLSLVKKAKYGEMAQSEIENRKLPKRCPFAPLYHILDLIGSDSVQCIESPTGRILRL